MKRRRVRLVPLVALLLAVTGCGQGENHHSPNAARLPLVAGAKIVTEAHRCDKGANAYCAVEMVVVGPNYRSSTDLVKSERAYLDALGWTTVNGDTGNEKAAESPGHSLRLTYSTADGDLTGIDLGWIKRPRSIALALSHALFYRAPAMSLLLELGPS
jgi:hypothetical protein